MKTAHGWSTPSDLRQQLTRQWDRLLGAMAMGEEFSPLRLRLKRPSSSDLSAHFAEVRDWIAALDSFKKHGIRIVWKEIKHRTLGQNRLPDEVWVDTLEDAALLTGNRSETVTFLKMIQETKPQFPELLPWLGRFPRKALGVSPIWSLLLSIVAWMRKYPRPKIYLRQVDLPGVHSKLIEENRAVLSELFDLVLPPNDVDRSVTGVGNFCKRYGFRDKPLVVRFRVLDPKIPVLNCGGTPDITVTHEDMVRLRLPAKRVFLIENEITYLAFPPVADAIAIFGAGYCFDNLKAVEWLKQAEVFYWGDIDTHGFAILDQLRAILPDARSFFMDLGTLLTYRDFWVTEPSPKSAALQRLTIEEFVLYHDLCSNAIGPSVRLEQERIPFSCIEKYLQEQFSCA